MNGDECLNKDNVYCDFFRESNNAVFVFSEKGDLLWKNELADALMKDSSLTEKNIFAVIENDTNKTRNISLYNGGFYYKMTFDGDFVFVAEFYCSFKPSSAFGMLAFEKYLNYSDTQIRQAVTGISAACELLDSTSENSENTLFSQCLENIMVNCCRLMRNVTISSQLAAAANNTLSEELVNIPDFMTKLVKDCISVMGKDYCIDFSQPPECFIKTDKTLFMYFMLMLIRKIIVHKNLKLGFNVSCDEKNVQISIFFEEKKNVAAIEYVDNVNGIFEDAYDIISQKLNAECNFTENGVIIKMKRALYDGNAVFETDRLFFSENMFSPSRIMLCDLTEFRSFY